LGEDDICAEFKQVFRNRIVEGDAGAVRNNMDK
jgi:hypothetical protein